MALHLAAQANDVENNVKTAKYLLCSLSLLAIGVLIGVSINKYGWSSGGNEPTSPFDDMRRLVMHIGVSDASDEEEEYYLNLISLIQRRAQVYGTDWPVLAYVDPSAKFSRLNVAFAAISGAGLHRVSLADNENAYWLYFPCPCAKTSPTLELTIEDNGGYVLAGQKYDGLASLKDRLKKITDKNSWFLLTIRDEVEFRDIIALIRMANGLGMPYFEINEHDEGS